MNKKELKEKLKKVKSFCKEHQTELIMALTGGVVAGIATGRGYKKGWNDAFDKYEKYTDEHCAYLEVTEPCTPRDFMRDDAIAKTYKREDGAPEKLDKQIREIQFWF